MSTEISHYIRMGYWNVKPEEVQVGDLIYGKCRGGDIVVEARTTPKGTTIIKTSDDGREEYRSDNYTVAIKRPGEKPPELPINVGLEVKDLALVREGLEDMLDNNAFSLEGVQQKARERVIALLERLPR